MATIDADALRAIAAQMEDHEAYRSDAMGLEALVLINAATRLDSMEKTLRAIESIIKIRMYRGRTEPFLTDIQRAIHAALGNQNLDI